MKIDLVLVAGGSAKRFNSKVPKQFENVNGRPLYLWSLDTFLSWQNIGEVVLVVPADWVEPVRESFKILIAGKKVHVVSGGASRQESATLGVLALRDVSMSSWVMIHDAARPLVTHELLDRLYHSVAGLNVSSEGLGLGAVIPGVSVNETIKEVNSVSEIEEVEKTLVREKLRVIQTPQFVRRDLILKAYDRFHNEEAVDDASLIEKLGYSVFVVRGEYDNVKVTFQEDLEHVSRWLRSRHPQI